MPQSHHRHPYDLVSRPSTISVPTSPSAACCDFGQNAKPWRVGEGCVEGLGKPLVAHFRVQLSSWCVALSQACNITMVLRTEVGSALGSLNAWSSIPGSVWILFVEVLQSVVNPWTRQETPNRPGLGFLGWKSGGDPQFLKPQPGSFPPRA